MSDKMTPRLFHEFWIARGGPQNSVFAMIYEFAESERERLQLLEDEGLSDYRVGVEHELWFDELIVQLIDIILAKSTWLEVLVDKAIKMITGVSFGLRVNKVRALLRGVELAEYEVEEVERVCRRAMETLFEKRRAKNRRI